MDFYFTDRQYNLLGIASTERGQFRMAGEIEAQSTTASTVALTGNIYFAKGDLNDAIAMVVGEGGNYILYEDDRGVGHFMTIVDTQVDNTGCSINFQSDDAGNDLKNEIVGTYAATKAQTFAQYFSMFCADGGWEIGINEIPSNTRTLEFTSEQSSYDRMLEVANDFGVSIYYSFKIDGLEPVHRYMNVVNRLGSDTNVTLRQGTDISQIVSETSTADLHTSIKAYGATPDGKNTPLNLVGYKWTDSTGQFVLGGDGVLRDTIAIRTWSRLRSNTNPTPEYSHLQMVKSYEATTQATLLQSALADLKTYNHPAANYTVTMARVPSELSKGDVVNVEDEAQNLYLSATVLEVDKCYSLPNSSKLTLGDFIIQHDQTSAQIKQAAKSAEDAVSKATTAFSYASQVETTASEASSTATQAQATANDAASKASEAQNTATSAQTTANTAKITADGASVAATDAASAAATAQILAKANRTFIKSATAPDTTDLPINAVWLAPATTDSNGKAVAASAKTWSGTEWQDTPIESSLIADNIVGKKITGSTFANTSGTFSIDKEGNITGSKITGSEMELSTIDTDALTKTGILNTNGLLFDSNYKNVATDTSLVQTETAMDWYGPRVIAGYKNGSNATVGINPGSGASRAFAPQLYATRTNSNGKLTGYTALSPDGITVETFDSSANNTGMGTVTPDQIIQLSNVGRLAWSGVSYLGWSGDAQYIDSSINISDCLNGWLLVWHPLVNNQVDNTTNIRVTPIWKSEVLAHSGIGITLILGGYYSSAATKYVYPTNTRIKGNTKNNDSPQQNIVCTEMYAF